MNVAMISLLAEKHGLLHPEGANLPALEAFVKDIVSRPTDKEIKDWADGFIRKEAYNRPIALAIANAAAKWIRDRDATPGLRAELDLYAALRSLEQQVQATLAQQQEPTVKDFHKLANEIEQLRFRLE